MLQPKRTKFRKAQKGRMKGISGRGHQLSNGMFGIKSLDTSFITARQIEAARIAATRYMKREGQLWIKIFPDKPITKKPLEVRMGKGKGAPEYFVAVVLPGRIMFEIAGNNSSKSSSTHASIPFSSTRCATASNKLDVSGCKSPVSA